MATLPNPQPPLLNLPNEILKQIAISVEVPGDAAHLAVCNRRLQEIVNMPTRRKFHRIRFIPNRVNLCMPKLLVNILRRPELGCYARHIELDCHFAHGDRDYLSEDELNEDDKNRLCKAIRDAGIVDAGSNNDLVRLLFPPSHYFNRYHWNEGPLHQSMEIFAALAASLSPNVVSVSCCDLGEYVSKGEGSLEEGHPAWKPNNNPGSQSHFGRFLQRASQPDGHKKYLQKLREVRLLSDTTACSDPRFYERVNYCHIWNVSRRLPAIESIRFDASISFPSENVPPPPRSANYRKIAFHRSIVPSEMLHDLFLSTKALTHLALSVGGRSVPPQHQLPYIELGALLDALLQYQETLEHLDIDADDIVDIRAFSPSTREIRRPMSMPPAKQIEYEKEWANELATLPSSDIGQNAPESRKPAQRLSSLYRLKHLGLGIYTMYYLARGIGKDHIRGHRFKLVDQLPPSVESLQIYGIDQIYKYETTAVHLHLRRHVWRLRVQKAAKLPLLRSFLGVNPSIPNGESQ